jgi:hypothetical protein
MPALTKGKSPFYPGQPVPVELFVGRQEQIEHILTRGVGQVRAGKPVSMFVRGEYGIGKSSIAGYVQELAERDYGLHGIYATLGSAQSVDDIGAALLKATVESGAYHPSRGERIRNWLAKYIGEQPLFGVNIHLDALKKDGPSIAAGMLPFLRETVNRLQDIGVCGVFLVLDEINGIAERPEFAYFLKSFVDQNALARQPLPLLLMLCGVEERRRQMIRNHQPVERLFDIIEIEPMSRDEGETFFRKAFGSAGISVEPAAMEAFIHLSGGFPKIMHIIGDWAFWLDQDGRIPYEDALRALVEAAEEVGRRYVDEQVYGALKSAAYRSVLKKIAPYGLEHDMRFRRRDILSDLSPGERAKLDNFLQRMKGLGVLRQGEAQGEWVFTQRMVAFYIWTREHADNASQRR